MWKTDKNRAAVVNSASDKSVDQDYRSIMGERPQHNTQLSELVIAAPRDQVNVL
jgi:hypothetical protein